MSQSSNGSGSSRSRRRTLFALTAIRPTTPSSDEASTSSRTLKKNKHGQPKVKRSFTDLHDSDLSLATDYAHSTPPESPLRSRRPSVSGKSSIKRAPSIFDPLRSLRSSTDELDMGEPLSATSTRAPSFMFPDGSVDGLSTANMVLLHGGVQTSAGMFRKKKEFLVLTETHILRYKSHARAAEIFKAIPHPTAGRSPTVRHESFQSIGSASDLQTLSDSSGDKDGRVSLRQVVAVVKLDDGRPYFALEIAYLDEESAHAAMMTLQFSAPDERDVWLKSIRDAVIEMRLRGNGSVSTFNLENAARVVERDHDYDPAHCTIYKIVQRQSASKHASRSSSSSDDMSKVASTVCLLAIGIHKLHIIPLVKNVSRTSSPSLASNNSQASYGILNLVSLRVGPADDTFELTFRQPLQKPINLYLASAVGHEIAARLHFSENYLRPECGHRLFRFNAPPEVEKLLAPVVSPDEEHSCLDRTLSAYCVAYGVNPANVRYTINYECEDAPRFELLPPADTRRTEYGPLDLLAIMRALRYNESFGSICLAGISLDCLNGLHDAHGQEHVCSRTKRGTPIHLTTQELGQSCLLVQEIRALAATSKKLRRMDLSGCITSKPGGPIDALDEDPTKNKDIGCGIVEALSPLCKHQTTNVDWICLNGIALSDVDLDHLVGAAVDRSCHFRAIELNRCGLNDRSMGLILDALRAQDNTLEAIEIAGNPARLNPASFDGQLSMFGFIRKLNLSYFTRTSGDEPILQAETLLVWRLQELRLSGTALNPATIEAISTYLAHPQSDTLHELYLDNSYLTGHEIAARLHFSENYLRPECGHRLFRFNAPPEVEKLLAPVVSPDEEHSCLDRTLSAYCVAYGVNPANVRYTINYECEDAPRFELLPPADTRRTEYGPLDLLAIMRALRYNESFGSICLAGISLDCLNGLHDAHGQEHVCSRTKRGTPIHLTTQELGQSCLLVQEIRALAATSKKLRRMDLSGCITSKPGGPIDALDEDPTKNKDIGCGIVEALSPLCKHQTTNVDWICLNGIALSDVDLDHLVGAAVDRSCHFRAIELNRCGLNDRSMGLILDALRAQDNTLEAIEIAGNPARLNPASFDGQLSMFGFIRKLNLSYFTRTSGDEPILQAETLLVWRLQELRLSGTALNPATIEAISTYLAHPQSDTLHELYLDNSYLTGNDLAILMQSLALNRSDPRELHVDISQGNLSKGLDAVTKAIEHGKAPSHLSMRAIEWREESQFRKIIAALIVNKSIRYLDMSQTSLPGDASDETCRALERLLAENDTLTELNLSGEDSRLATSKFGSGINTALVGLKSNTSLLSFRIEGQKLGLQGSSTLSEVLKENHTLRELYCDNNEIPLQGLTDLVNALIDNTTLTYLPTMDDGRAAAFKAAERTMKMMADEPLSPTSPSSSAPFKQSPNHSTSAMRKGLASVRRTATRSASSYTPSFPALSSYAKPKQSSEPKASSPFSLTLPPPKHKPGHTSSVAPSVSFTVQDIQITQRLLTEQWDRQCFRLSQYLERNWCLLNTGSATMTIEDEKFERPSSVASISKMLEQVKYDTTPRVEKAMYFDSLTSSAENAAPLPETDKTTSFKSFLLGSTPTTPELDDENVTAEMRQLSFDSPLVADDGPSTPTQSRFRI
nr:isoform 2 of capping protein, arp2/3 and myosin-i linker protein 2 [Quercus suber]